MNIDIGAFLFWALIGATVILGVAMATYFINRYTKPFDLSETTYPTTERPFVDVDAWVGVEEKHLMNYERGRNQDGHLISQWVCPICGRWISYDMEIGQASVLARGDTKFGHVMIPSPIEVEMEMER